MQKEEEDNCRPSRDVPAGFEQELSGHPPHQFCFYSAGGAAFARLDAINFCSLAALHIHTISVRSRRAPYACEGALAQLRKLPAAAYARKMRAALSARRQYIFAAVVNTTQMLS